MTQSPVEELLLRLQALFTAVADEAAVNPTFARKMEAVLSEREGAPLASKASKTAVVCPGKPTHASPHTMLHNVTFDPLELHLEAALMNGREAEARAFLGKLNHAELKEVVKAQRLPGAKSLQKAILEATDPASAVDAIVDSAAEKVRSRYYAAS